MEWIELWNEDGIWTPQYMDKNRYIGILEADNGKKSRDEEK